MPPKKKDDGRTGETMKNKLPTRYQDSITFLLQNVFKLFTKRFDVPSQFKNMTALKKFMKSYDYINKHSAFFEYHVSRITHDAERNIEDTQLLGNKKHPITFVELCVLINSIMELKHTVLPITKVNNLTLDELLDDDEGHENCYILQVTWNRESDESMKHLRKVATNLTQLWKYMAHVDICDDKFLTDEYDCEFSGLLFFMGGLNMGLASHITALKEPSLPINSYYLFNLEKGEESCCRKMRKDETHPTLVKRIDAVYKLCVEVKNGVVQQLVSPYDISESKQSSTAVGSNKAKLPEKINDNIPIDKMGFEDLNSFWTVEKRKAEGNADADVGAGLGGKLMQEMNPTEVKRYVNELNKRATVSADAVVPRQTVVDTEMTKAASSLTNLGNAAVTTKTSTTDNTTKGNEVESSLAESIVLDAPIDMLEKLCANVHPLSQADIVALNDTKPPFISETSEILLSDKASTVAAPSKKSEDMVKKLTDPVHAGTDEATLKLVEKLKNEDCSTHVKSPNDKLSSANARKQKSSSNKLSSALKNLKSGLVEPISGTRKRKLVTTTGFLLPSAKRQLVIKSDKSRKTSSSSSSTSKKDSNKASLKKIPDPNPNKLSSISSKNTDSQKATLNRFRESTNGNKKSSSSTSKKDSKKDDQTMKDNPVMTDSYRSVVKGSPHFKEYRNAPPEPVNSQILQNKVTRYRVIINSEWINQQVYMLMEINRLVTQIRRTTKVVAPRELWLKAIPTKPSHPNYPYQLLFIMICSSALSDATLTKRMKSLFDLIQVEPEEIIKMSVGELERMLHGMGTSNENAANILSMTKDVLDNHDGKVPADWNTITKFHGVGRKIASVVMYEAFGISRVPVDIHVLKFARYFGWCSDKAEAKNCQEDIEGWMPEIYWHLVNSTIGSFCQLAASHKEILYPEMKRMRIGLINHKFDMQRFLKKYVEQMESKKVTKPTA